MSLKDLSGKTVNDLDREDFEKPFCQYCHEYEECPRDDEKILRGNLTVRSTPNSGTTIILNYRLTKA